MFLELICFLCGAGLAISGSLTFWPVRNWWDFYIPLVLYMAGWIASIGLIFIIELLASLGVKKIPYNKVSGWARFWFNDGLRFIINHAHIWTKVTGAEKVPQKQKFVLVCNHRSKFDNFIITNEFMNRDIAFITKKENNKIPIAGRMYNGLCYISVDRDDKIQSFEAFKRASTLLANNTVAIGVFPEGKRQSEKTIGEFHEGPFNIAIHSKVPLVVATIKNTDLVHKRWPLKATSVKLDIIACLNYEDYSGETAKALADRVHQMMEEHLQAM